GRSALTMTPCTAATVPIAPSVAGHRSSRATVVVTASGGGRYDAPWAIAARIWKNLSEPMVPMSSAIAASLINILLRIAFLLRGSAARIHMVEICLLQARVHRLREAFEV